MVIGHSLGLYRLTEVIKMKYIIMIQNKLTNHFEILNTSNDKVELDIIRDNLNKFFFFTGQNNQFSVTVEEIGEIQ